MLNKPENLTLFLASLEGGGIQKATMRLIHEFIKTNIRVTLVVVNARGRIKNEIPGDCTLVDLDCQRTRYAIFKLIPYLLSEKPAIAISSQTHLNVLIIFIRLLIGYPKHLIVQEHITFNAEMAIDKRLQERLRPWLIRLFYPFASRFVTVSTAAAKSIHHYAGYKKDIQVIQNGLDIALIHSKAKQLPSHLWLNNKVPKLIIGMGRLSPQKNFSELLKAFSLLENKQNYRLIILGEGPELEKLITISKELDIQDYVDFPGFIENPYSILARADVFILSSKWEGYANVVIEALACGVPVIATDCPGGPSDILADKPFAKIVAVDDPAAMACAIEDMLAARNDKTQIAEYAKRFNIKDIAQQYVDLINGLQ